MRVGLGVGGRKRSELANKDGQTRGSITRDAGTHGTLDGPEGEQVLGSVAAVSTPGLIARVVSLLQDKLLSLVLRVLVTHPARRHKEGQHPKIALNT